MGAALAALVLLVALVLATTPRDPPSFAAVRGGWRSSEARLLARDGQVLDIVRADPRVRRLDWVPLGNIAAPFVAAAIASEDKRFAVHHGVDWRGVGGALRDRLHGRRGRGASTITMQLAGLLAGNRGGGRSWPAKIEQARAALAIERAWTKAEILEAWVNLLPFRGDLVGIDAAARALAGKPPAALDMNEARVLVSLLPAPTASPARVAARACAAARGDCAALQLRTAEMLGARSALPDPGLAPQVAARLLAGRREVTTTLDADLQAFVAATLRQQLAALAGRNARDGAAIVVDNASGDILAYVGSAGAASLSGAVDGAASPRQAGSSLKPFLYELAIERRLLTAASVLDDSAVDLDTASGLYIPQDYDRVFRGPVSVRSALGNSLNVPAVRALLLVGVDAFRDRLFDAGYRGISRDGDYYGFSLALGSAEVTLAEQAAAYRALARGGRWSALRLEPGPRLPERAVLDPQASAIVADILADPAARSATFGADNTLELPFSAAVKTGTSKALRDNWCIGFSDRFTVAVWVGNFEGDAMGAGVSGVVGAAPAWRAIMLHLHRDAPGGTLHAAVSAADVRFEPAIEPPRRELFLPGTALGLVRVAATAERPRIIAPADGTVIALDPDIPPARQRVAVVVAGTGSVAIDGRPLGGARLWAPLPGYHHITLSDGSAASTGSASLFASDPTGGVTAWSWPCQVEQAGPALTLSPRSPRPPREHRPTALGHRRRNGLLHDVPVLDQLAVLHPEDVDGDQRLRTQPV